MSRPETCAECLGFDRQEDLDGDPWGFCRRLSPRVSGDGFATIWPTVHPTDWCLEGEADPDFEIQPSVDELQRARDQGGRTTPDEPTI